MNEHIMRFRVGVMILATILITMIVVLLPQSKSLLHGTYPIYVKFDKAQNVNRDTPVRKAGIVIGRVREVNLVDDSGLIVTADIERGRQLYSDEECKVTNSFPLGDASLEIVKIPNFSGNKSEIKYGANMPALESASDITGSIASLQQDAKATMGALTVAGRDMHELLGDRNLQADIRQTMTKMPVAFDRVEKTFENIDGLTEKLGGERGLLTKLDKTVDKLDRLTDKMLRFSQALDDSKEKFQQLGDNMLQFSKKLNDPKSSLGALLDDKGELYQHVNGVGKNLDELTGIMLQLSQQLNDPQNSLGALLHDKELYPRVTHTVKNVEELTRDLKPLLDDARVFTDKIARHPEVLGVRGAIKKDAGLKDIPANDGSETDVPPEASRWPIGGSGRWSIGR